jgi:hypothetical protein
VLSIGIFFTLMIVGLSGSLPASLYHGLIANGVSPAAAHRVSDLSPVSTLFAALLGYNPIQQLVGPDVLVHLPHAQQAVLTGRSFFPSLIAKPFKAGLHAALDFAILASLLAAAASWTRGGQARRTDALGLDHTATEIRRDRGAENGANQEPVGAATLTKPEGIG